jgi:hypothetical protein
MIIERLLHVDARDRAQRYARVVAATAATDSVRNSQPPCITKIVPVTAGGPFAVIEFIEQLPTLVALLRVHLDDGTGRCADPPVWHPLVRGTSQRSHAPPLRSANRSPACRRPACRPAPVD